MYTLWIYYNYLYHRYNPLVGISHLDFINVAILILSYTEFGYFGPRRFIPDNPIPEKYTNNYRRLWEYCINDVELTIRDFRCVKFLSFVYCIVQRISRQFRNCS